MVAVKASADSTGGGGGCEAEITLQSYNKLRQRGQALILLLHWIQCATGQAAPIARDSSFQQKVISGEELSSGATAGNTHGNRGNKHHNP